ncbi:OB-fold protein [Lysobacter xanthus]
MSIDAAPKPTLLIRAAWACLALAVVAFLLPLPAIAVLVPGIAAGLLALMAQLRGAPRAGGLALITALVLTPLLYMLDSQGMRPQLGGSTGFAGGRDTGSASTADRATPTAGAPAATLPAPAGDAAMRTAVTAYELSSTYATDAKAADDQYKGKRLLVTGLVAGRDGTALTLAAGDFPAVRVEGVADAARAAIRDGQQISLACNGAGATAGAPVVDGCTLQ